MTNDTTPTISGTGEVGATISVIINGETLTTTVDSSGNWSVTPTTPLDDGSYTADVTETDTTGDTTETNVPITIDTTVAANTIDIASVTDDTGVSSTDFITSDTTQTFNGTLVSVLQADERVQVSTDGGVTWTDASTQPGAGTTWSHDTTLAEGSYTVEARIIDTAGNIGATDSQAVEIDT
ncbi:MAG: Ig-like domain-containing protein, partial [Sulfurovaceae bacterium]|nr:Ig-like domain-containing protein [Sulfurovaceae bacterium]